MKLRAETLKIAGTITLVGALCGLCLFVVLALDIEGLGRDVRRVLGLPHALVAAASIPGAAIGGIVAARLFGHPGKAGWALALLGAVLSTLIGSSVAGILLLRGDWFDGELILMFPIMLFAMMIYYFPFGLIWLALMALTHRAAAVFRGNSETVLFRNGHVPPR